MSLNHIIGEDSNLSVTTISNTPLTPGAGVYTISGGSGNFYVKYANTITYYFNYGVNWTGDTVSFSATGAVPSPSSTTFSHGSGFLLTPNGTSHGLTGFVSGGNINLSSNTSPGSGTGVGSINGSITYLIE